MLRRAELDGHRSGERAQHNGSGQTTKAVNRTVTQVLPLGIPVTFKHRREARKTMHYNKRDMRCQLIK
jgi:hypothetical protein